MKTDLIKLTIKVDDHDLAVWLWQESIRLNISSAALVRAVLIDAMLESRDNTEREPDPADVYATAFDNKCRPAR